MFCLDSERLKDGLKSSKNILNIIVSGCYFMTYADLMKTDFQQFKLEIDPIYKT